MDIHQIKEKLAEIYSESPESFCGFEHLSDGKSNNSYRYTYRDGEYVIRVPKDSIAQHERYLTEKTIYDLLENHKLSGVDELVHFDIVQGIKITKYIDNARYPDTNDNGDVKRCITALRNIHLSGIVTSNEFKLKDLFESDESRIRGKLDIENYLNGYEMIRDKAMLVYSKRADMFAPCFNHIDPIKYNFLLTEHGDYLIDFEYSMMASPMIDLAAFAVYAEYTYVQALSMIENYLGEKCTPLQIDSLLKYLPLESLYSSIWYLERIEEGEDMEKNMTNCFNITKAYISEAEKSN